MYAMPNGQESQSAKLAVSTIAQPFQALVHIFGYPVICLYVETVDIVLESSGILEYPQLNVRTTVPIGFAVFSSAIIGKSCAEKKQNLMMNVIQSKGKFIIKATKKKNVPYQSKWPILRSSASTKYTCTM